MAFNQDYLNYQTRLANGCIDTRPGAYDSGERGFYEQHSGRGGFTSQATVDRHNDYVYKNNNGDFPDRLHGQSAVRERQPAAKTKKRKHWFWPW